MVNDLETLLIACALATVVVTGVFATTVAMRHNDEANRAWTASFAAALCVAGLEAIYGTGDTPIIVAAVINASSVFALGAMWAGCRLLDGRTHSYIWIPFAVSILVMVPVLALTTPDRDLETAVRCGVSGVFAWLAAVELVRGGMRSNLNARILQTVFGAFGAWYVCAAAISFAAASDNRIPSPPTETVILPFVGLFIVAAICLSALRVERTGNWWSMNADARRRTHLGVLASDAFRDDARDRIERAAAAGTHVGLVLSEIDHLDDLNAAFGRESGDRALVHFSGILRDRVPSDALLGHLGAGRFVVLVVSPNPAVPLRVAEAIRTGLMEAIVGDELDLRVDASFGTSHTSTTPPTFEALLAKADSDLDRTRV
jgi:diguanylate cyclase (GGDEF)-like protein